MALSVEQQVGQMFLAGFHGLEAPPYLLEWLAAGRLGGVILFGRNVESPAQLARLTDALHQAAAHPLLVAIDQEGGTVARLRAGFSESPGALALAAADRPGLAMRVSRVLAAEMRAMGINWNYAPSVDLTYNKSNPTVGTRSFGSDPHQVSRLAAEAVTGFQMAGVAACAKHFPGLGDTTVDTHLALPTLDTPLDQLRQRDLLPYQACITVGLASVMTTHTIFSALDDRLPVTLSPVVIRRLLREELRFAGVVTTDCLEMKAIADHYGAAESATLAALAGVDLILFSHTPEWQAAAYDGLLAAVQSGRVELAAIEAANRRIAQMKAAYPINQPASVAEIASPDHLGMMREAAEAGLILLRGELPLDLTRAVVIEFASILESEVVERGGLTGLAGQLRRSLPRLETVSLMSAETDGQQWQRALALAREADRLVLVTRNAHLIPEQLERARALMRAARETALICLRNPYDVEALPGARVALCSCGDSRPSIEAVVGALLGDFPLVGKLPVEVAL